MIGVFDSGIGGLTVMRELLRELPECGFVYLGDTARTPYGTKGPDTIRRYAREDAQFLIDRGARLIVVACNTASALAADDLRSAFPNMPIVEVVTPAVEEAIRVTRTGRIGVIGTRATIASGVYEREIASRFSPSPLRGEGELEGERWCSADSELRAPLPPAPSLSPERRGRGLSLILGQPCPLLVPLVEEGWLDQPETELIVRRYLQPLRAANIDTLILGCTHYPLLESVIAQVMGDGVVVINPAHAVAATVRTLLKRDPALARACRGASRAFHFTDTTPHTERIASEWLGMPVGLERVAVP